MLNPHPNPYRGDIALQLSEQQIILRPTFAALAAIEQQTSLSLLALARRLANGEGKLTDLQNIISACALSPLPDDLPALLQASGILQLHELLLDFLIGALTGETNACQ